MSNPLDRNQYKGQIPCFQLNITMWSIQVLSRPGGTNTFKYFNYLFTKKYLLFELFITKEYVMHYSQQQNHRIQWPNLKNLSGGLNLSLGLNMVGST